MGSTSHGLHSPTQVLWEGAWVFAAFTYNTPWEYSLSVRDGGWETHEDHWAPKSPRPWQALTQGRADSPRPQAEPSSSTLHGKMQPTHVFFKYSSKPNASSLGLNPATLRLFAQDL